MVDGALDLWSLATIGTQEWWMEDRPARLILNSYSLITSPVLIFTS